MFLNIPVSQGRSPREEVKGKTTVMAICRHPVDLPFFFNQNEGGLNGGENKD